MQMFQDATGDPLRCVRVGGRDGRRLLIDIIVIYETRCPT